MSSAFDDIARSSPLALGPGTLARAIEGEGVTVAYVELGPDGHVPEHRHVQEQVGMLLRGSLTFRVGDETRELGPGATWRIPSDAPHEARSGPEGAVLIEAFAPRRDDWDALERGAPEALRWPL